MKRIVSLLLCATLISLLLASCARPFDELPAPALLDRGEKHLQELEYERAVAAFTRAAEMEPETVRAYTGAAEAYGALGNADAAIFVLQRGMEQLPDNVQLQSALAGLLPQDAVASAFAPEQKDPEPAPVAPAGDGDVGVFPKVVLVFHDAVDGDDLRVTCSHLPEPYVDMELIPGALRVVKLYYSEDTTISFSREFVTAEGLMMDANAVVSPAGFQHGAIGGTVPLINGSTILLVLEDMAAYDEDMRENGHAVMRFGDILTTPVEEGYPYHEVGQWLASAQTMSVILHIPEEGQNKIIADYNGDGKADLVFVMPGVYNGVDLQVAEADKMNDQTDIALLHAAGRSFPMYTISVEEPIEIAGLRALDIVPMVRQGNLLYDRDEEEDMEDIITAHLIDDAAIQVGLPTWAYIQPWAQGSDIQIKEEGYYLFAPRIHVPHHFITDIQSESWGSNLPQSVYTYIAIIIHAVDDK